MLPGITSRFSFHKTTRFQSQSFKSYMHSTANMYVSLLRCFVKAFCDYPFRTLVDIWEFSHLGDIVECNEKLKQNQVRHQFLPTRLVIFGEHFVNHRKPSKTFETPSETIKISIRHNQKPSDSIRNHHNPSETSRNQM